MAVMQVRDVKPGRRITGLVYLGEDGQVEIKHLRKAQAVKTVEPRPGRWRTHVHVHVNGSDCWDGRTRVAVG